MTIVELLITLVIIGGIVSIILSGISGRMQYRGVDDFPQFKVFLDKFFKYVSNVEVVTQTRHSTTLRISVREFSGDVSKYDVSFEESDGYLKVSENVVRNFEGLKGLNFSVRESGVIVFVGRRGDSRKIALFYPFVGR